MTQYFIRRLLLIVPTFIGITILVFVITRFVPGGPIERMIAEAQQASMQSGGMTQSAGSGIGAATLDDEQIKQLEEYYGFDKPVLVSYWEWL
ncbi:MAG: ABC transporter permease, partial [Gammaproteobacteria bacterium]|nr:ABC transporter permease [Gammaproteobacteria bacterium]